MSRTLDVQTLGSVTVIGGFIAAECSASLLSAYPGWPLAWYLNLGPFRPFEAARAATSPLHILYGPCALHASIGLLIVTFVVRWLKQRLAVAAIANLSFAAAAALVYASFDGQYNSHFAALGHIEIFYSVDIFLLIIMFLFSFFAFALSHLFFITQIWHRNNYVPVDDFV